VCVCVCVCTYACMHICMYVYVYESMCVCMYYVIMRNYVDTSTGVFCYIDAWNSNTVNNIDIYKQHKSKEANEGSLLAQFSSSGTISAEAWVQP